jgi:Arc/MetJ-type ribon-helix-helix transcriptional regulator
LGSVHQTQAIAGERSSIIVLQRRCAYSMSSLSALPAVPISSRSTQKGACFTYALGNSSTVTRLCRSRRRQEWALVVGRAVLDFASISWHTAEVPNVSERTMPKHIDAADLPEDLARLAQAQVAAGLSTDVEGAIRRALEDQQRRYDAKMAKLRAALIAGEESGIAPDGVVDRVVAKIRSAAAKTGAP